MLASPLYFSVGTRPYRRTNRGKGMLGGGSRRHMRPATEQRTDVVYGIDNVVNAVIRFASTTSSKIDACVDSTRPSLAVDIELLQNYFLGARRRGVRLRYVTEVTKDNIHHCKKLQKMVDELRHLDGIKGNFYLSEKEYLGPATKHER